MPRPTRNRKMCIPPKMQGFIPYGMPKCKMESEILLFEEYESIKLLDYELLNQEQAAEKMNVSQPTLTRIYEKARRTIAKALVEGKAIEITGGNVEFEREWFKCKRCHRLVEGLENHVKCKDCPSSGAAELVKILPDPN